METNPDLNEPTAAQDGSQTRAVFLFFLLAFAITWIVWVPRAMGVGWAKSVGTIWTYAPLLAAFATALLTGGRDSARQLAKSLDNWRFGLRWYLLIILGPAALALVVAAVSALFGAGWGESIPDSFTAPLPVILLLIVILSVTDGLGEEMGWRGFALPRMLAGWNATISSILLGIVWAAWHLPLFFTEGSALDGASIWILMARLPATAIIFTWVFAHTGGSVVAAIVLHGSLNLFAVAPASAGQTLTPDLAYLAAHWLIALVLVIAAGSKSLDRWPGVFRVSRTP